MLLFRVLFCTKRGLYYIKAIWTSNLLPMLIVFEKTTNMICIDGLPKNDNFVIKINDYTSTKRSDEGQLIFIKCHQLLRLVH